VNADLVPVPSQVLERLAADGVDVARVLQQARLSRSQLAARAHLTTHESSRSGASSRRSRVLEGTQPQYGHSPPTNSRSTTASVRPLSRKPTAIASPATPPPRQRTSNSWSMAPIAALPLHAIYWTIVSTHTFVGGALPFQGSTSD
jgi:hypothetical protein